VLNTIEVSVKAGYRIHMGFYRFLDEPFIYGSLGAAIEIPQFTLTVKECDKLSIEASSDYAKELIKHVSDYLGVRDVCVSLSGYVKHHVGLGSTTRIVMAALVGITTLKRMDVNVIDLAFKLGRGKVSSVGIYSFMYGNLVVDTGFKVSNSSRGYPKPLVIIPIPRDWYVVIALPEDRIGLREDEENKILSNVEVFHDQSDLYKHVVTLMTAAMHKDFKLFSESLRNIQLLTGKYFSKYQGGIFCCDVSYDIIKIMEENGIKGVGQSSWGPTVYGFTNSYLKAVEVRNNIHSYFYKKGIKGKVWITNIAQIGHKVDIMLSSQ